VILTDGNAKSVWCLQHTVRRNAPRAAYTRLAAAKLDWTSAADRAAILEEAGA
jgi:hypothetical protein